MIFDEDRGRCVSNDDDGPPPGTDAGDPSDTGGSTSDADTGSPDLDTGPGEPDTEPGEPDTGPGEPDTGPGEPDTGPGEPDTGPGEPDTGPGDPDTGPGEPDVDPGDLPECGGNVWDDTHDGENPWEEPLINCDHLNASWDCELAQLEEEVLALVNERRSEDQTCGSTPYPAVGPVEMNELLQCASRIHTWDMIGRGYTGHDTPEGITFDQRIGLVGAGGWVAMGENINYGSNTASGIVSSWMNSPGHCANMMRGDYQTVGVGVYSGYATLKLSASSN